MTNDVSQAEILTNCLRSFIRKGKEVVQTEISRDLSSSRFDCCMSNRCQSSAQRCLIKIDRMPHRGSKNRDHGVTCTSMAPPRCGALDRSARLKRNSERDLRGVGCVCTDGRTAFIFNETVNLSANMINPPMPKQSWIIGAAVRYRSINAGIMKSVRRQHSTC